MATLKEKIFYNALNLASETNLAFLSALKENFGSFKKGWEANNYQKISDLRRFEKETIEKILQRKNKINPDSEWQKLADKNIELTLWGDKNYPPLLKEIPAAPLGIYQLGKCSLEKENIAIVGTRKASSYGKMVTEKIVKDLVRTNLTIVSGLAYGIDTFSHLTALEAGGETLAILGSGLDIIFPSANTKLAKRITEHGALISEYPLSAPPLKHHFPERNRIISGLSLGVLIVEAPLKSGALITGRFALDQNREVFAVPGQIFSKNSEGTNELIKAGAKLVNKIDDILLELNLMDRLLTPDKNNLKLPSLNAEEKQLLEIIGNSPKPLNVDELIEKSGLDASLVNQNLTFLELKNLIKLDSGGYRIKF